MDFKGFLTQKRNNIKWILPRKKLKTVKKFKYFIKKTKDIKK